MVYRTFFSDSWLHEYVDFEKPYRSRWKIMELISEHPHHVVQHGEEEDDDEEGEESENPMPSHSQATFLCRSVREPSREAFLRVYMQIPHLGTEDASHAIRSAQAGTRSHDDIEAMTLFCRKHAKHVPRCLGLKKTKQDIFGLVPGGYMSYMLWEKLPGIRLDEEAFWSLDRTERDAVREGFVRAYRELYNLGLKPLLCGLNNLLWDQKNDIVYIIGFSLTIQMFPDDTWHEKLLAEWELAIPPKHVHWWGTDYVHKGIAEWKV